MLFKPYHRTNVRVWGENHFISGLYSSQHEKDSCGIGFVANRKGRRSHGIIAQALVALKNMAHRGAQGSDGQTGDGAGILVQLPYDFLTRTNPLLKEYPGFGVGMIFMPRRDALRVGVELSRELQEAFETIARSQGLSIIGWRKVPTQSIVLGVLAKAGEPEIWQVFIARPPEMRNSFERELYRLRKNLDRHFRVGGTLLDPDTGMPRTRFYISSLSCETLIYKGLLTPSQLEIYYSDLTEPDFTSALAMVHSRFSTNTFPAWELAHPFRMTCHNGEINTIRGNVNWMSAREGQLSSPIFGDQLKSLFPIIQPGQSDSACLDNALEFLVHSGRSLPQSLMMLIPEPWIQNSQMSPQVRDFYEYHSMRMEPWDGPAAVCFTDGRLIGATLDRNGLRPCRYQVLADDTVILASEAGVVPVPPETVVSRGRLEPGQMFLIDLQEGRILSDEEAKRKAVSGKPYRSWIDQESIYLKDLPKVKAASGRYCSPQLTQESVVQLQKVFGYTLEELSRVIFPMAVQAEEPQSSMGNDTPLAILSDQPQLLFKYFRQLFAQVTNPPIDPIRERRVMSLATHLGPRPHLLLEAGGVGQQIRLPHPILSNEELSSLRGGVGPQLKTETLTLLFDGRLGLKGLRAALIRLCRQSSKAVQAGNRLLILSDRGVDSIWVPLPSLLALSAVHHHLIAKSQRTEVDLVVETGEARDVHHLACLIGYGAGAVNPYLVFETLNVWEQRGELPQGMGREDAHRNYLLAVQKGLLKIISKMGISTIQSYCGAQIFEVIGLSAKLVNRYFRGTESRIGGLDLDGLATEALARHKQSFKVSVGVGELEMGGDIHYQAQSELHFWNPETISTLQWAAQNNHSQSYDSFSQRVALDNRYHLRGLLKLASTETPLALDQVEPASEIVKRFTTGAMSFGALGTEAHETLALAMNQIGAKSNSGEGGEDPDRFEPFEFEGMIYSKNSAIKQVASARFGVTTHYLLNAKEIQIKMAQGAKPGEGGQLPGYKVDEVIARMRYSTPGVQLISPPPHHDIYSIEDLSQLIFDLKSVNPEAEISVKLVAELGVGTVAAGVAKAHADKILISGDAGGTGASPLSSIKYAGIPWEMGLAETHQTLVLNGLRHRVRLETDGQLKTGRDVLIAALLGAEEFGFSTAPLIVEGCIMMRKCHLNTCPVGVATQDPELRKKFKGRPEHVINYFFFVAEEVRALMSQLGVRTMQELIGRTELLSQDHSDSRWKVSTLDISKLFWKPLSKSIPHPATSGPSLKGARANGIESTLDQKIFKLWQPELNPFLRLEFAIFNTDRSVGAYLSGQVVKRMGPQGLPSNTIQIRFKGSAGQSFGVFLCAGVTLTIEGEANDFVGKGLSGGRIILFASRKSPIVLSPLLIGNTCLYGATAGELFVAGTAGERFGVRNSGAVAVVEGVGDHGCEYMTGGVIVVLGPTGRNFAAGMSGGIAYVLDEHEKFLANCNLEMVLIEKLDEEDRSFLKDLLRRYYQETQSYKAKQILESEAAFLSQFKKLIPIEFKRILIKQRESHG